MTSGPESSTLHERVGGTQFFFDLVEKFYEAALSSVILVF